MGKENCIGSEGWWGIVNVFVRWSWVENYVGEWKEEKGWVNKVGRLLEWKNDEYL